MRYSQIGLQLALVVFAVVLYETIRTTGCAGAQAGPVPARGPSGELLSGMQALTARVADLERRVDEVTRGPERASRPVPAADRVPPAVTSTWTPDRWQPAGTDGREHPAFAPRDLAWFSALRSEVERLERQQRAADLILSELGRLDVDLADGQREEVVRLTLALRHDVRSLLLHPASDECAHEKRTERLESLRSEYEAALRGIVCSPDAEAITDRLGRYPGAGSR